MSEPTTQDDQPWAQRLLKAEAENRCGDLACQTRRVSAAVRVLTGWKEHQDYAWAVETFEVELGVRDPSLVGREPDNIPSRAAIEAEARATAEAQVAELRAALERVVSSLERENAAQSDNALPYYGAGIAYALITIRKHFALAAASSQPTENGLKERVEDAQRSVREEWPDWLRRNRDAVHVPIVRDDASEPGDTR